MQCVQVQWRCSIIYSLVEHQAYACLALAHLAHLLWLIKPQPHSYYLPATPNNIELAGGVPEQLITPLGCLVIGRPLLVAWPPPQLTLQGLHSLHADLAMTLSRPC